MFTHWVQENSEEQTPTTSVGKSAKDGGDYVTSRPRARSQQRQQQPMQPRDEETGYRTPNGHSRQLSRRLSKQDSLRQSTLASERHSTQPSQRQSSEAAPRQSSEAAQRHSATPSHREASKHSYQASSAALVMPEAIPLRSGPVDATTLSTASFPEKRTLQTFYRDSLPADYSLGAYRVRPTAPLEEETNDGRDSRETNTRRTSRSLCWALIIFVSITVITIAVGVGVGVGLEDRNAKTVQTSAAASPTTASSSGTLAATSSADPPASATAGADPSPSATSPASSAISSSSASNADEVVCPGSNGTLFSPANSGKGFMVFCGIDYSGSGEATDIGNITTTSMAQCINSCATFPTCTGCSWGYGGDIGSEDICYLKASLIQPHTVDSDQRCFARLVGS